VRLHQLLNASLDDVRERNRPHNLEGSVCSNRVDDPVGLLVNRHVDIAILHPSARNRWKRPERTC